MEQELAHIILSPINEIAVKSNLQIVLEDVNTFKKAVHHYDFVEARTSSGQITIGSSINTTLINMSRAIQLDNPTLFSTELLSNTRLKIGLLDPNLRVVDVITFNPIISQPIFTPIITNPALITKFGIINVQFLDAGIAQCSQVKVRVTTNLLMTSYCRGLLCNQTNSSVVEFITIRGEAITFKAVRNSQSITQTISPPSLLTAPNINILNTPFGATITGVVQNPSGLNLQYSLDNIHWQTSNVFSGLDIGNYTLYVKDQLGCSKSKGFSVLENSFGNKPFAFISKENSFRFKEPNSNYPTDENQYFNQSTNAINYCFIQDFLNSDVIITQFKSNYSQVSVFVKDLESNQTFEISVVKRTNNLGIKQKLSNVKKYRINNSQFGVYFESGSILNYDSNIPIESYSLNGSLPIWAKLGNFIDIGGSFYQISSIGFDENRNAEVLIFDGVMSVANETVVASSIYNLQDYEVYEFEVSFMNFSNSRIQIEIRNSDSNYGNNNWISEEISSHENLEQYLEIRYYNSTNTNVVYATGIQYLLRIPFNKIKAVDSDTSESYNTDTNSYLLDSRVYEITEFDFMPLPLELWRKLKIALSVDTIFIDGVGYSKNAEFTKEALGSTNLYKVSAQMIKNGFVFTSQLNSNEIIIESPNINIPGLIQDDSTGFIQY